MNDDEVGKFIQALERRDLDQFSETGLINRADLSTSVWGSGSFEFLRIKAISSSIPDQKSDVERYLTEDVLSGIHGLNVPFVYLILGTKLSIEVYVGILNTSGMSLPADYNLDVLASTLQSTFPNIDLEKLSNSETDSRILKNFRESRHYGVMSGTPTAKFGVESHGVEQIEKLIRGLYRQEFGYMVISEPVSDIDVINAFDDVTNLIKERSSFLKETSQYTKSSRLSVSGETLNRSVQYYIQLLEILLEKLDLSKAQGMWRAMTYFFSPDFSTANKMSRLLKTVFSGDKSTPEAIRTIMVNGLDAFETLSKFRQIELDINFHPSLAADHPLSEIIKHKFGSALNSRELSTLVHLPKEEMPGYAVRSVARFGVCFPETAASDDIVLGEIFDRGRGTGHQFRIPIADLTKHGLIVGVTGSGKTNTCMTFLDQLWNGPTNTPFLVIEPAKSEYRSMVNAKGFESLKIYTLGDESTSPFRLNPFEVLSGVRLQTHIDNLKAVFNASFVMYAPMPYVLETCIHEIYKDYGWDLTANRNRYSELEGGGLGSLFPTLTDLYEKIDPVVTAMGYDDRITMDIKAGLKVRVGSLRIGGKGSMLDTSKSIPMKTLLSSPAVLELNSIGDDEEKAFIIGLLIARLYEYRETERETVGNNEKLKHVTLVEEAHRLLSKTSSDFSNLEAVSTKAKSVETFCNILSEIRAFGEGILIAEQIPAKLAPDAIKNTNLKVMHRVVAKDDRDLVGDAMNLRDEQNNFLSTMDRGKAVIFSEGLAEPFYVEVPYFWESKIGKVRTKFRDSNRDVARMMSRHSNVMSDVLGKHGGCRECRSKCLYRDVAKNVLLHNHNNKAFEKFILSTLESADNFIPAYGELKKCLFEDGDNFVRDEEFSDLIFCFLITAGEKFLKEQGRKSGHPTHKTSRLLISYYDLINAYFSVPLKTQLSVIAEKRLDQFRRCYMETYFVKNGPFPGCNEHCKSPCLFRYSIESFVVDKTTDADLMNAINRKKDAKVVVKNLCLDVANEVTTGNNKEFIENIALCFFIQKSMNWNVQEVLLNIREWFFTEKV